MIHWDLIATGVLFAIVITALLALASELEYRWNRFWRRRRRPDLFADDPPRPSIVARMKR